MAQRPFSQLPWVTLFMAQCGIKSVEFYACTTIKVLLYFDRKTKNV